MAALLMPLAATDGQRLAPAGDRVPTLTEVVELGHQQGAGNDVTFTSAPLQRAAAEPAAGSIAAPADRLEITAGVLAELQPRIELLLDARLREALAPALARAADGLIRDTREQLGTALQALVQEVVAKVLEEQQRLR